MLWPRLAADVRGAAPGHAYLCKDDGAGPAQQARP